MRYLVLVAALSASVFALDACAPAGPGGPAACSGGTQCVCVTGACACSGEGMCQTTCEDNCQVACSSARGCNSACGENCTAACSGTGHCHFDLGTGSQASCTADQSCDVTCYGSCLVTFSGRATSTTVTCMQGAQTMCGLGVVVCARACP
jgi:hypothetical protein